MVDIIYRENIEVPAGRSIKGSIPAPLLYKGLGTHQQSKKHEIRGYSEGNSHVLEIVKKGVFLAEKDVIFEIRGNIFNP